MLGASEVNNYLQISVSETVILTINWQLLPGVTACHIVDRVVFLVSHLGCRELGVTGVEY